MPPLVISHAACGGHAPENTLAGVRAALGFGVDGIEIDLHCSSDNVPILMHDPKVDRTTDGSGEITSLTIDQLQALNAGGEPPPTLAQVLELTRGNALLIMEIKQPGIEEHVAGTVHQSEALGDVMVWSFFPKALQGIREAEPRIPAALLVSPRHIDALPGLRERAISTGLQGVSVHHEGLTEDAVRDCRRAGLAVYTWTPDEPPEITRLIGLGVDGICSNYPDRVLAALDA